MPLRAMVLLGVNCGLGNTDIANLPIKALDLKAGWVRLPAAKDGHRPPLPALAETVAALRRPSPAANAEEPEHAGPGVCHQGGQQWGTRTSANRTPRKGPQERRRSGMQGVSQALGESGADTVPGWASTLFATPLRRSAGDSRDQVAVDAIMGHARDDMASRLPREDRRRPARGRDGTRQEMAVRKRKPSRVHLLPGGPSVQRPSGR